MQTIVIANGKGGVGKTADSAHIGFHSAEVGLKTLVVDLDTGNLSKTMRGHRLEMPASVLFQDDVPVIPEAMGRLSLLHADRLLANVIYMSIERAVTNFRVNLAEFEKQGFDLCVVDTPASIGIATIAALRCADAVISPVEMEDYSIEGIKDMMRVIIGAKQHNPKLQFLGIVPNRVDRRNPRQVKHLAEVQEAHGKLLAPVVVGLRTSVADALAAGEPVWKSKKTTARAAAAEMRALGDHVLQRMGVTQ
ncbi:chromosome partitioning protein ParA [Achromobacter xylosoxidans]|uniref:ParA family protein n=1 Tax=Achromobacter aegrifaciens TaxID=1287736 RepID=UPI000D4A883C|nr:ParA family protein [Achromobacter aegrifaciens]MDQ1758207.1 ParA family protein [Achromobacter aegrifaciens]PTN49215.1 chromosome partitioning protein ParA [Achromobacter xylosoxidans]